MAAASLLVTLLPQALRSGSLISPSVLVPASQTGKFYVEANMVASDLAASKNTFTLTIQSSSDSGATWQDVCGCFWTGGASSVFKPGQAASQIAKPGICSDIDRFAGRPIRATLVFGQPITTGFVLTLLP